MHTTDLIGSAPGTFVDITSSPPTTTRAILCSVLGTIFRLWQSWAPFSVQYPRGLQGPTANTHRPSHVASVLLRRSFRQTEFRASTGATTSIRRQSLDYYKSRGFDLIRLPFLWERLQPALFSDLADAELSRIKQLVAAARDRCMRLILSPHNFGRYSLQGKPTLIGSVEVPDAAFGDFWKRTASAFAGEPAVYGFSLMNEPHDMNGAWSRAAQVGLDAIRSIEPQQLVLVPGDHWTGAWSWKRFNDHFSVHDGSGRVIYEAHQYSILIAANSIGKAMTRARPIRI